MSGSVIMVVLGAVFAGCLLGILSSSLSDRKRRRREEKGAQKRSGHGGKPSHMQR